MKEIITVQFGRCGNSLGSSFWEELSHEHGILKDGTWCGESELQLQGIDCFFSNGALRHNYVPRCVLIDLDPTALEAIRLSPSGQLFSPDTMIFGKAGSGNNFARGRYAGGRDIQDICCETIRHETELSDQPIGFQLLGGLGGGTGSGVGSLMLELLKDEYPKMVLNNYVIMPGGGYCSDAVVEPFNAALAAPAFINFSDLTVCMDNQRLYEICHNTLKLETPLYEDINSIIAKVLSGLSATYRFPSKQHVSWRMMKCLLVPSPKLHFFVPGYVPLNSRAVQQYRNFSVQDITYQMLFAKDTILGPGVVSTPCCPATVSGKYLTGLAVYRGYSVADKEVTKLLTSYQDKNKSHFCPWMPYHFVKSICEAAPKGQKISAAYLVNHSGPPRQMWGSILKKYKTMFKKKAFLHWFYNEGQTEDDFKMAEDNIRNLMDEYKRAETEAPKGWEEHFKNKCMSDEVPFKVEKPYELVRNCNFGFDTAYHNNCYFKPKF